MLDLGWELLMQDVCGGGGREPVADKRLVAGIVNDVHNLNVTTKALNGATCG